MMMKMLSSYILVLVLVFVDGVFDDAVDDVVDVVVVVVVVVAVVVVVVVVVNPSCSQDRQDVVKPAQLDKLLSGGGGLVGQERSNAAHVSR